jgi:hypothetical protein
MLHQNAIILLMFYNTAKKLNGKAQFYKFFDISDLKYFLFVEFLSL